MYEHAWIEHVYMHLIVQIKIICLYELFINMYYTRS